MVTTPGGRAPTGRRTPKGPASQSPPRPEGGTHRADVAATLVASVDAAVAQMTWLKATDRAAVDLALTYAARIDAALADGEGQEVTKALYLGPHLLNTLRALGGTPSERKALAVEEVVGGKLAQLRSVARPA